MKNDACPFNGMKIAFNCIKLYFFPEWLTIGLFCLHVHIVPCSILAILQVQVLAHGSPRTNLLVRILKTISKNQNIIE